jgi:hypothetical protein
LYNNNCPFPQYRHKASATPGVLPMTLASDVQGAILTSDECETALDLSCVKDLSEQAAPFENVHFGLAFGFASGIFLRPSVLGQYTCKSGGFSPEVACLGILALRRTVAGKYLGGKNFDAAKEYQSLFEIITGDDHDEQFLELLETCNKQYGKAKRLSKLNFGTFLFLFSCQNRNGSGK